MGASDGTTLLLSEPERSQVRGRVAELREIQRRQSFNEDLLKPCILIDNPHQSREIVRSTGATPTHPGAESILEQLAPAIDEYAAEVERVYAPVWSCMAAGRDGD